MWLDTKMDDSFKQLHWNYLHTEIQARQHE